MALDLACCVRIERKENVAALVPSGTGKTDVALGLAACRKGVPVVFVTVAALVHDMMERAVTSRPTRLISSMGHP